MKAAGLWELASGVPEAVRRVKRLYFGWVMVGLGALILALGSAPLWGGLPVWSPVLRNQFGWTTVQLSWAFAVTRMEGGLLGPLEGLLIQRLGTRRVVFIGLIMLGSSMVLFSRIQELWQLYATFFLMSMGSALCTWLPIMTLVNHWFVRHKARAMSFVLEGAALGAIASPVLLAWAIGGSDPAVSERFGWRNAAMFLGFLTIALAFPLSSLLRNRPEDVGLRPDGDLPRTRERPTPRTMAGSVQDSKGSIYLAGSHQDADFLADQHRPRMLSGCERQHIRAPGADARRPGILASGDKHGGRGAHGCKCHVHPGGGLPG